MSALIHKTILPCLSNIHPSRDSSRVQQNSKNSVVVEYQPNESFTLSFISESNKFETTTGLLQRVIEKLGALKSSKGLSIDISAIVSLETKNKVLSTDYLLSLPNKSLDFVAEGTVIVPYFAKTATSSASSSQVAVTLEDYEFLAQIGQGGFAKVYLARMKQTGKFYAIKQIKKRKLSPRDEKNLLQERNSMIEVNSAFVARLFTAFQTKDYCYLVMEYMAGGDLLSYFEKKGKFSEENAKFYVAEIALGLHSLHEKNILFRDLKPENVLTDLEGHAVLSDFGLSKKHKSDELNQSICGTPHFIAPEVYKKTGYTHVADYFALGVLAFELVTGKLPFISDSIKNLARKIVSEPAELPSAFSSEFKDFIGRLLEKNPATRLGAQGGAKELLAHPWLKSIDAKALAMKKLQPPQIKKVRASFESLPAGFNPEKPNLFILGDLYEAPKTEESQRIAMFSYYSSNDESEKKHKAYSDDLISAFQYSSLDNEMGETEECVSASGKNAKTVSDYVLGHKLELSKKIFA